MTDVLIKVALASRLEDFACVGVDVQLLWLGFPSSPSGPGHQVNHWHKSLDAGEREKKMAAANNATHEK